MKEIYSNPCLFKVICFVEIRSKFMKVETAIFLIIYYISCFLFASINDQPNAFFPALALFI